MRCTPDAPFYPDACDGCVFATFRGCVFPIIALRVYCWDYIRKDCYFVRVWPKSGEQDKS
jgi:hypothetical protein